MPTKTGIFTKEEAETGHLFSYRLAQYIGELFTNELIYDMGCGMGSYARYLEDVGFNNVIGVEGTQGLSFENKVCWGVDLTRAYIFPDKGHAICIEVGEHIPKEFEEVFINNICKTVKKDCYLVLSWAHEGQDGYGHVNCRPDWWVKEEIEKRGFEKHEALTINARNVIEGHVAYLKENLFVFKKI